MVAHLLSLVKKLVSLLPERRGPDVAKNQSTPINDSKTWITNMVYLRTIYVRLTWTHGDEHGYQFAPQQFADLGRRLSVVTNQEWENLPEVGNLMHKKPSKSQDDAKVHLTPAADGTMTNLMEITHKIILSLKLDHWQDSNMAMEKHIAAQQQLLKPHLVEPLSTTLI
ncbi:hypothetical protein V8E55_010504 [Tylopilus felleus]